MEFLLSHGLAIIGFVSGLLCVWLLVRENVWTFPLGLIYSVATVVVVARSQLYADVLLNGYYVLMNAYGWYFWLRGGDARRQAGELIVGRVPTTQWPVIVLITLVATLLMGWYFDTQTDAALAYPDSATTVASFVAMWMSAKKYLESWLLWFVIDVAQIVLYMIKAVEDPELYWYALLYLVYLALAVMGWRAWRENEVASVPQQTSTRYSS